jgi:hypothetical protein
MAIRTAWSFILDFLGVQHRAFFSQDQYNPFFTGQPPHLTYMYDYCVQYTVYWYQNDFFNTYYIMLKRMQTYNQKKGIYI